MTDSSWICKFLSAIQTAVEHVSVKFRTRDYIEFEGHSVDKPCAAICIWLPGRDRQDIMTEDEGPGRFNDLARKALEWLEEIGVVSQ